MAFGEAFAIGCQHEGHVRPPRPGKSEEVVQVGVAGGRREKVIGPDDLLDGLGSVVDDHDEVVGRGPVTSPENEIVDHLSMWAMEPVDDFDVGCIGPQSKRRWLP